MSTHRAVTLGLAFHAIGFEQASKVIVYSSVMIGNRPDSVRSSRSRRRTTFLVAQAFTGSFGQSTRTMSRESVGRWFEPRRPHVRAQFSGSLVASHTSFTATVRSNRSAACGCPGETARVAAYAPQCRKSCIQLPPRLRHLDGDAPEAGVAMQRWSGDARLEAPHSAVTDFPIG